MLRIPLYTVVTPYGDESGNEPVSYASAASYARVLDTTGIPATVTWNKTVTVEEYLNRK